jgi:6-phosphogluconolactonase/glucosamine-6-phosphate isomerase/deaminase
MLDERLIKEHQNNPFVYALSNTLFEILKDNENAINILNIDMYLGDCMEISKEMSRKYIQQK